MVYVVEAIEAYKHIYSILNFISNIIPANK